MSESLLSYFEQELRFIREEAEAFSERHPGAASALGLHRESVDDPQIARLIESVAFLNGRLQKRLDDNFPALTEDLIRLLYPHFLRPVPAFSMLKVELDDDANARHHIPALTEFDVKEGETQAVFRTTSELAIYPFEFESLDVSLAPFEIEKPRGAENAKALIELDVVAKDEGIVMRDLDITSLDVQLRGDVNLILRLYDLLFHGINQIAMTTPSGQRYVLGADALTPIGFEPEQSVLPYPATSFGGFKLLTEFFVFSERFHAFRIDLSAIAAKLDSDRFTVEIYLDDMSVELVRGLALSNFALYCTPVINLQQAVSEPMQIDFLQNRYPIVMDAGDDERYELFAINHVTDVTDAGEVSVPAVYGDKYTPSQTGLRWQLQQFHRESGVLSSALNVADLDNSSPDSSPRIWQVNALCSNGRLAAQLSSTSSVVCRETITIPGTPMLLRRPSMPAYNRDIQRNSWALLAHLHFNYHTILGAENPAETLQALFKLYNHNDASKNEAYIAAISLIEQEQVVAPIRVQRKSCFAYGTRIVVTLNTSELVGGVVLFSHLLDRFFAYFAGFNSFTQLDVVIEGQEGVYLSFPRRSGCKTLL
ncbi:type VI secretion system baseplate subunit TssF [Thaumasiovibrio subtropicus]|uniref:type VI secretion system baseplate subunit TssF n=1 Tax=Thaumasiovibrio subtropicus TaxID=1891207 RepID=UPI000B364069|nr:type VI secretion system baseplate subunit TssF [Thaumasiovibrio subtropicus]